MRYFRISSCIIRHGEPVENKHVRSEASSLFPLLFSVFLLQIIRNLLSASSILFRRRWWLNPWKWLMSVIILIGLSVGAYVAVTQCVTPERDRPCYSFGLGAPFLLCIFGLAVYSWHLFHIIKLQKPPKVAAQPRAASFNSRIDEEELQKMPSNEDIDDGIPEIRTNQHTSLL